ncbi:MAG: hypothetical protein Q8S57_04440 [Methanoregula sp.]|nr:hypothetical protein [Methanoregula sp.]
MMSSQIYERVHNNLKRLKLITIDSHIAEMQGEFAGTLVIEPDTGNAEPGPRSVKRAGKPCSGSCRGLTRAGG